MRTSRAFPANARSIAAAVREERLARGLRQSDLARSARMKQSAISRLENARFTPRLEVLSRVAGAMGLTLKLQLVSRAAKETSR